MSLKANVGDLIQYRYLNRVFVGRDTRRVEKIDPFGYWVEGGCFVDKKNVLTVIPMHESRPPQSGHRDLPLEADQ